jgi:cytochrome c peroxidase
MGTPQVAYTLDVCAEPTGVVLAPNGTLAVVACFGEPTAVIVQTSNGSMQQVALPGAARAAAISTNGDAVDTDEHAYLPVFFGVPVAEGRDDGRRGLVVELSLATGAVTRTFTLSPIADTGYGPLLSDGGMGPHVGCAPNQLAAISLMQWAAVIPYTCVSPGAPATATSTLFSALAVIDLDAGAELRTPSAPLVLGPNASAGPSFMAGLVDVDFFPDLSCGVTLAQGANRAAGISVSSSGIRVTSPPSGNPSLSSVSGCGYPMTSCGADAGSSGVSISIYSDGANGFIANDWNARALIEGGAMQSGGVVSYAPAGPAALLEGRRLFYTALDRWSRHETGSCASCHPDGLSDNVTWMFSAGPRQTPSLDGTFAKGNTADHRAQNWTANFDEIYDVEGVVRNVLGGRGAITSATDAPLSLSAGITIDGVVSRSDNLSGSTKSLETELSFVHDWAAIEQFIQGIRTNAGPAHLDAAAVGRGRAVFSLGACDRCHAGPKWTSSHVPYSPSPVKNGSMVGDNGMPAAATGLRTEALPMAGSTPLNHDTLKVAYELSPNPDGGAALSVGPERITCVLRDVGTYDAADVLERKPDGTRSQGALGFNVPSLLGLATSAPYFHRGQAATLQDVFGPQFAAHTTAGNASFAPTPAELDDLVTFLKSIDATTSPFPLPGGVDLCDGY